MRNPFPVGARKMHTVQVSQDKLARFEAGLVHPVYSTFALAQDAEWVCRLFVLDMLDADEEGVGSLVTVRHLAPAVQGATVVLEAELLGVEANCVRCRWTATCGPLRIAEGEQEQRIVNRARFAARLAALQAEQAGA